MRHLIIYLLVLAFGCSVKDKPSLRIATSSNMQFAMDRLIKEFQKKNKIDCELVISSSGKLTSQIREGAPFDIFVSADTLYPNQLVRENLTLDSTKIYAYGRLVIWSIKPDIEPVLDSLSLKKIKHIAIANPKTAPYGTAAIQFLTYHNLHDRVKDKLVFGESISQTNHFIISGAAEIGITAKSIVLSPVVKAKGKWSEPEPHTYQPIAQGMVILNKSQNKEQAQEFKYFLLSEHGKEILELYGYHVP